LYSEERLRDWLHDIVENADQIGSYLEGIELEDFRSDAMRRDAVERCLQRITEAYVRIGGERMQSIMPALQLHQVRGLGNLLRHEYERTNPELVWNTVKGAVPELRQACARALGR
jgi:uncharacterized protein with HEPN domain